MQDFYVQKLNFRKPSEAQANKDLSYQEVLDRVDFEGEGRGSEESGDEEEYEYGSEEDDAVHGGSKKVIMELIAKKQMQEQNIVINWEHIIETLNNELPEIPAKPVVE